jgi:hypothetical protein
MFTSSTHLPANGKISFFFVAEKNFIVYKYIFLIHLLLLGHHGCFHSLAIVNSAVINMIDKNFKGSKWEFCNI